MTGAASGIGAAITARLRADGLDVVTLDRAPGCDLCVDVAAGEFPDLPNIDVCVANAGVTTTIAPAHRMTAEQWQLDLDVNLTGAFRTVQACLGGMRERRYGRIVVVSSIAATTGLPGQVAYAASKAGQLGMIKTLASENASRGITANAVLPGLTATEKVLAMPQEVRERAFGALPTGRPVEPSEIAAAVAFLASGDAAQVSGQALAVDGAASLSQLSLGSTAAAESGSSAVSTSSRRRSATIGNTSVVRAAPPTSAAAVEGRMRPAEVASAVIAITSGSCVELISASAHAICRLSTLRSGASRGHRARRGRERGTSAVYQDPRGR